MYTEYCANVDAARETIGALSRSKRVFAHYLQQARRGGGREGALPT